MEKWAPITSDYSLLALFNLRDLSPAFLTYLVFLIASQRSWNMCYSLNKPQVPVFATIPSCPIPILCHALLICISRADLALQAQLWKPFQTYA